MNTCGVKNLSFTDFYAFYEDLKSRIIALNVANRSSSFQVVSTKRTEDRKASLSIAAPEREINELRTALKKETQFNKKLELNVSVKEQQANIIQLEKVL